jgi:hypothetical protein
MIPRREKYLVRFYFKKEPSSLSDFLSYLSKLKDIHSERSKRKLARALLYYAKHSLQKQEFEFLKRRILEKVNINPKFK